MAGLYYPPTINGLQKQLGAQLDKGVVASATLNNTTNIQNKLGLFVVDRIDASGNEKSAAVREYIAFTGTSGNTVTNLVRGLGGTTDQDHPVGAVVEFVSDVVQQQAILDTLANAFNPSTGALDTSKVADLTTAQTLTNKRVTKRITTASDATSITPNTDNCDITYQANTQGAGTLTINADSGTPTNGQFWELWVKATNAQTASFNAVYVAMGTALPTTFPAGKNVKVLFQYDSNSSKWGLLAVNVEQ
jgi:hypothetical protein